jgi:hypothetical protein
MKKMADIGRALKSRLFKKTDLDRELERIEEELNDL